MPTKPKRRAPRSRPRTSLKKLAKIHNDRIQRGVQDVVDLKLKDIDPSDHYHLLAIAPKMPTDYIPYGVLDRGVMAAQGMSDCSSGCRWYHPLDGNLGKDWGVCSNPCSPRTALLTFEHQGCHAFQKSKKSVR